MITNNIKQLKQIDSTLEYYLNVLKYHMEKEREYLYIIKTLCVREAKKIIPKIRFPIRVVHCYFDHQNHFDIIIKYKDFKVAIVVIPDEFGNACT